MIVAKYRERRTGQGGTFFCFAYFSVSDGWLVVATRVCAVLVCCFSVHFRIFGGGYTCFDLAMCSLFDMPRSVMRVPRVLILSTSYFLSFGLSRSQGKRERWHVFRGTLLEEERMPQTQPSACLGTFFPTAGIRDR